MVPILANVGAIILIVIAAAFVAMGVIAAMRRDKQRQATIEAWAGQQGLHYTPGDVSSLENRFGGFDDFTTGDNRYGYNVMRGDRNGRDVWAFDYHFQTTSHSKNGTQTHHHHFSAVVIDTGLPLKPLSIRSENFFDKITQAVGFDDIDFESAEFSRQFFVKSPDKRWAYSVLHQETMEYLLESPRFKIYLHGPYVMVRRSGRFKTGEFEHAIEVAEGVLERIPKDIVAEMRS